MTLLLPNNEFSDEYRTGHNDPLNDFYIPCLKSSIIYYRSVGYFSSSLFQLTIEPFVEFALRGGKAFIISSPKITEDDFIAINSGYKERKAVLRERFSEELKSLVSNNIDSTTILATLIKHNIVNFKIALYINSNGIYHEKLGVFIDKEDNIVSFRGSSNETYSAWGDYANYESFDIFRSWLNGYEYDKARKHFTYIKNLWGEHDPYIEMLEVQDIFDDVISEYSLNEVSELADYIKTKLGNKNKPKTPLPHQKSAINNWEASGSKGILKHATGSGKTITSIIAVNKHLNENKPVLILVPSVLLLRQWNLEIKNEIPDSVIILAGDNNNAWKKKDILESFTHDSKLPQKRIVISTLATAQCSEFRSRIRSGEHLLVVCDEVHRFGSPNYSKISSIKCGKCLGLSATPERYGDVEGTNRIFDYFKNIVPPEYSLNDAINDKRLVPYEYYPSIVYLDEDEYDQWALLTQKINRSYAINLANGNESFDDSLKLLLIKRSRIIKKASKKIGYATQILVENYMSGDHWLVYCEDTDQLEEVYDQIRSKKLPAYKYYTGIGNEKDIALDHYRNLGGIMVAIRCLDEGVDIPEIDSAIIIASSQNPREFIQRRGRVLRQAPNKPEKTSAKIFDSIVLPPQQEVTKDNTNLSKSEFLRALEFAKNALNRTSYLEICKIATQAGIDINEIINVGIEEEVEA
jgi:superfamily II DNA or RNA helicase